MRKKQSFAWLAVLGLGWLAWAAPDASAGGVQWERYVSQKCIFTLKKPAGWVVTEGDEENPRFWYCSVMDPTGAYQASMIHGASPTGRDVPALAARLFGNLKKQYPSLDLRPKAWTKNLGDKVLLVSEGTYTDAQNRRKEFKNFLFAGDGTMLNQRIEAPEGELSRPPAQASEWTGVLLETLGSIKLAQYVFDAPPAQPAPQPVQFVPHRLASGWGQFQAPADWQAADLSKGQFIAFDSTKQLCVIVANASFISPQYYRAGMPGVLCSSFVPPSQAFVKACTAQGAATNFRILTVNPRPDVVALLRAGITGGRPCAAEDFTYTFTRDGKACKGFTFGMCTGDYMNAGFTLGHFTMWATADQFDAVRPTLLRILCSYQINEAAAQRYVSEGLRRYAEGIQELSRTITRNSEEMRRENFELFMRRGESQRYIDYMRSRTIMGEWDYVVRGAGGYEVVRSDHSGLYTQDGEYLTHRSYGEPYTNSMTPIDSRAMFERYRPW